MSTGQIVSASADLTGWPRATPIAPRLVRSVDDEIDRARAALAVAQSLLGREDFIPPAGRLESVRVVGAVKSAEAAIRRDLRSKSVPATFRAHLATTLVELGQVRVALREAEASARTATNLRLSVLLATLRPAVTVAELIEAVPRALGVLGYYRVMVSQVRQGRWIPLSSYVRDDPGQAAAMNDIAGRVARLVDPRLVEYDMLDQKRPILVLDAPNNGRVHPELLALTDVRSYAGAPIVVESDVVGFVHADCTHSDRQLNSSDAMLLMAVGEVVALALEKAELSRRLQRITDLVREPEVELMARIERVRKSGPGLVPLAGAAAPARAVAGGVRSARLDRLSPRELTVLRHLAAGASNTSIAIQMGIAETTVKTHLKHVIRKLGCANRAEATAVYLRLPYHRRS